MASSALSAAVWLLALELLSLATLPLALRVFYTLPDRGYAVAKILGLVVVAYVSWLTAILGLTAFSGATIAVLALILGGLSWALWGRYVVRGWREARLLAVGAEVVFLATFIGGAWLRAYSPAIAGQEKQMDLTFLHSLIRTQSLPAEDLWLAGYAMPYYYFGYLTQSLLGKVTPVEPVVAYNLAMVTVLALGAVGAFGLAAGLIRMAGGGLRWAIGGGLAGAVVLMMMGNLQAFFEWVASTGFGDAGFWSAVGIKNLQAHNLGFPPSDGSWWFRAARVIPNIQPDGITEFPFFSFILNDLHPHYMAIPLVVLIAALAAQQLASTAGLGGTPGRAPTIRGEPVRCGVMAIVLGSVIPWNTWDVPVLWGTIALAVVAPAVRRDRPLAEYGMDLAALFLLAIALYFPYFVGYESQPLGVGFVTERTYFGTLIVLFGPLLVLPGAAGAVGLWGTWARARAAPGGGRFETRALPMVGGLGLLALVLLAVLGEPTLGFLVVCLSFWLPLTWLRARSAEAASTMAGLLTVLGLGSILVAEMVFLRDVFGTRMNTVFKFYYDAWLLLALAAPLLGWELVTQVANSELRVPSKAGKPSPQPSPRGRGGTRSLQLETALRAAAVGGLALAGSLAVAGLVYPLSTAHARSGGFASTPTLDGMSYLRAVRPDDAAAVEWLQRTHPGVGIVEAVGNDYTDAGRFSTFAGAPTLVGWAGHEVQWRGSNPLLRLLALLLERFGGRDAVAWLAPALAGTGPEIERRRLLAQKVYADPDPATWRALQQLGVGFIVVGGLERETYGPDAGSRLQEAFPVAHRTGGTTVYTLGTARPAGKAR